MRLFRELPRMDKEAKASILGAAACGPIRPQRVQKNIDEKGHPFSHWEAKPPNLWQRICEHHQVTHVIDFTPGSAALAIAASGAFNYEGIAMNESHRDWLDTTLDRCVMHIAGKEKDSRNVWAVMRTSVNKKASLYVSGQMMEARRIRGQADEKELEGSDIASSEDEYS